MKEILGEKITPVRIPVELHDWIKALAKKERRTINQQIVYICERAREVEEGYKHETNA
jgi:hypothetical protein